MQTVAAKFAARHVLLVSPALLVVDENAAILHVIFSASNVGCDKKEMKDWDSGK